MEKKAVRGSVILIAFLNPIIFEAMVRASITVRVIISVVIIAIPSFFMGIPFPYGIMKINTPEDSTRYLVAFSWGVNGFFSVLGSILVVMLSMSYGFKVVFIIGALLYSAAMLTARKLESTKATVKK